MSINNTTLLGLAQPVTGQESGVWGDDVNNGLTELVEIAIAGVNNITQDSDITLAVSNGSNSSSFTSTATNSTVAQYYVLNCSGSRTAARNIIVPTTSKTYVITNATTGGYAITIKKSGGTGVGIVSGETAIVFYNTISGDVAKISSNTITALVGILGTANGGTGLGGSTPFTANGVVYASSTSALATGSALQFDGTNLGLGVTPSAWASPVQTALQLKGGASFASWGSYGGAYTVANAFYNGTNWKYLANNLAGLYVNESGVHAWSTAASGSAGNNVSFIQAMTLDTSGRLLVGCTSTDSGAQFRFQYGSGQNGLQLFDNSGASGSTFVIFGINSGGNANIGSIARVGATAAVIYNTTSDYRLKTVTNPVSGQGERIDALKPIDYVWTKDGQKARGFLAHEFQEVYSNSVTGTKDGVDADGKPIYQQMQAATSEVIADLVAEIQSLRKRISTLENK